MRFELLMMDARSEGIEQGRDEGMKQGTADAVRHMKAAGMSVEQIASILDIDTARVQSMLQQDAMV